MKEYVTGIVIIIISVSLIGVKGDWLRCFCTESTCVQTSYMCKTLHGSCYSRLTFDPTSNKILSTRYGCDDGGILSHLEKPDTCRSKVKSESESRNSSSHHLRSRSIIPDEEELSWKGRRRHNNNNNNTRMLKSTTRISRLTTETETRAVSRDVENPNENSVDSDMTGNTQINNNNNNGHLDEHGISVVCCDDDMCNYNRDDTFERTINRDLSSSTNADLQRTNPHTQQYKEHFIARHANSDLWFKMAVCLVTVIGAAILVVIVISAMRMLRSEKRYFRRQQFYCDCPHHVIDAVLVAGDVSSKQQLLFPVADGRYCRSYYKSPLASPSSVEQQGIV